MSSRLRPTAQANPVAQPGGTARHGITARVMVAATIAPIDVREGSSIVSVPARLSVFRVGNDGTLDFERTYDVETSGMFQWWMGMVGLSRGGDQR